ncbi:helix-turn-helix transcriptional regulator [Nocardia farcinica]
MGKGPASFKLGPRRRVWRKSVVLAWIVEQEQLTGTGEAA